MRVCHTLQSISENVQENHVSQYVKYAGVDEDRCNKRPNSSFLQIIKAESKVMINIRGT